MVWFACISLFFDIANKPARLVYFLQLAASCHHTVVENDQHFCVELFEFFLELIYAIYKTQPSSVNIIYIIKCFLCLCRLELRLHQTSSLSLCVCVFFKHKNSIIDKVIIDK